MINPELIYVELYVKTYICTKFDGFNSTNEPRNAKTGRLVKQSIMCIFDEAEPP